MEIWANNANSTLASGISNSDLTLTVASGHGARFPSPGSDYFYVTLDDGANIEVVKCTARSTDTLTIVRAQQGTSAMSFATGTAVELRLTKGTLETLRDGGAPTSADYWVETANATLSAEVVVGTTGITTAAYASRQAAAKAGRLFLPNNGFVLQRDSGSAWTSWGPTFPFTDPIDGDFAWINQGGASVSTTKGSIYLSAPATAGVSMRTRKKSAPGTPYTITTAMLPIYGRVEGSTNPLAGICWRQSSDGKLVRFGVYQSAAGTLRLQLAKMTDATTHSGANYLDELLPSASLSPLWLAIADDGSDRKCYLLRDGQNPILVHTVGRTDFMTANEVGWFVEAGSATYDAGSTLIHWKETA